MSVGILGGTFDPPHQAHCEISIRALNQYNLDKVIFIPSKNPWQKSATTSYVDRYNMTSILVQDFKNFEVSDVELYNENNTYTVDTLQKRTIPKNELFFILGADVAVEIKTWNRYKELEQLTNFLIAPRDHINQNTLLNVFPFEYKLIKGEELNISSSKIRIKYEDGSDVNSLIPTDVLDYIREKKIY
jgi:nicotinate-nucleotide adenylyltransferase